MKYLDKSNCTFIKPAIAKILLEGDTVTRAVLTVREEEHIARHALILYGAGMEPIVVTSETNFFTSGYSGAGTRTLLTTIYLLLGFDVKLSYVVLDDDTSIPPYEDEEKNVRFFKTLAREARPLILSVSTLGDEVDEETAYCAFNFERGSLMVKR